MAKILIVGTGAWGTALAQLLLENKHTVSMYGIETKQINDLKQGFNISFFDKKMTCKPNVVSNNLKTLLSLKPDYVLLAVPSFALENVIKQIKKNIINKPIFINATKGFNKHTNSPWSVDIKKMLSKVSKGLVSLMGPSYASEVYNHEKTVVNVVSKNKDNAKKVAALFKSSYFRCSYEANAVGAEYCASFKNVMAIACGLTSQLNISIDTRAIMFTQAVKEISVILRKKHLSTSALANYCGVGDIFLTCTDPKSRNFRFGQLVAKVGTKKALAQTNDVIEGYYATSVAKAIVTSLKIEKSPVICSLYEVLYNNASPKTFIDEVIKRIII